MESISTIAALAQKAVKNLREAVKTDSYSEIAQSRALAENFIKQLNEATRAQEYDRLIRAEHPFKSALETCYIGVFALSMKRDNETGEWVEIDIVPKDEIIDLSELEKACKDRQLANNGQWAYWLESFTKVMAARVNLDLGGDSKKFERQYKISQSARACDVGATPTSNAQILKGLQRIIDGIIFDDNGKEQNAYKAISKDVAFMLYTMCKNNGRLTVATPRPATMKKLITEILHRIVTNAEYTAEYEMVKSPARAVAVLPTAIAV